MSTLNWGALLVLLALVSTQRVQSWGGQGHRLVALLAAERLTPLARRNVTWLLGPETLADVSSWADQYLVGNYQTFYWHFLNIPPEATSYDRDRDCPRQPGVGADSRGGRWRDCAVDRILYNKERLADTTLDRADRAIALKFLVHLVGDLHQPFHALGVGHGGNDIPVSVFGSDSCGNYPCNLHGVWDSGLIAHRALDDAQYLPVLRDVTAKNRWEARPAGTPAEWAMQSHDLGKAALLPPHGRVDEAYYRAQILIVEQRLALAGVRLAALLNEVLIAPPPQRAPGIFFGATGFSWSSRHMRSVTRRQLIQSLGVIVASAAVPRRSAAQTAANAIGPYSPDVLPRGIRSRFVDNVNGLRMHVLEAGYEPKGRPGVLLLHGFPELAYSWRKVMGPIAAAGYHVMAPDVRGYGRTSGTDVRYDDDLAPFRSLNQVRDMLGLVSAFGHRSVDAVIGHDQGSPLAAWCALVRPDVFRSVTMMSAPFGGPQALPFDTADATARAAAAPADTIYDELAALNPPRKHYQRYYTTREANENMWHASQGIHAFLRAYYHMKSADWTQNRPAPLAGRTAAEWAKLPRYYVMDLGKGMAETVAPEMPSAAAIAANKWLPDAELKVYSEEYGRTGFQGGLEGYRTGSSGRFTAEQQLFAGRTIDVPSMFIGGRSDWGVFQSPGALERMQKVACTKMVATHLIDGAGHWVQQEQPEAVSTLLVAFLKEASRG